MIRTLTALSLGLAMTSCSDTESENVKTEGISSRIEVTATGIDQAQVTAQLFAGDYSLSATRLLLTEGDTLTATLGEISKPLDYVESKIKDHKYQAAFDQGKGGSEFLITFKREATNESLESSVTLPPEFTISRAEKTGQDLAVTWESEAAVDEMLVKLELTCEDTPYSQSKTIPDNGDWNYDLADVTSQVEDFSDCTGKVILQRKTMGESDSQYGEGAAIYGIQERTATF